MNFRLLAKILGLLLLLLAGTMLVCLGYSLVAEERSTGPGPAGAFGWSIGVTAGVGLIFFLYGRKAGRDILRKEAIAVVGLGWLTCSLFGALPYVLCPPRLDLAAAIFESVSGFTTTGASVITDLNQLPRSLLLWRAFTQWLGGLGILVLFVALLVSYPWEVLSAGAALYLACLPLGWLSYRDYQRKDAQAAAAAPSTASADAGGAPVAEPGPTNPADDNRPARLN